MADAQDFKGSRGQEAVVFWGGGGVWGVGFGGGTGWPFWVAPGALSFGSAQVGFGELLIEVLQVIYLLMCRYNFGVCPP